MYHNVEKSADFSTTQGKLAVSGGLSIASHTVLLLRNQRLPGIGIQPLDVGVQILALLLHIGSCVLTHGWCDALSTLQLSAALRESRFLLPRRNRVDGCLGILSVALGNTAFTAAIAINHPLTH